MAKQVNGKTVESYSWHDFTKLALMVDGEGNNRKEFVYDSEGDPIAMRYNDEIYYFASDQVGTIYMVANSAGNEVKRIICDSFGNSIIDTNERINVPLGFAAGLNDRDTGLVHFGHREYDPASGRFIQPDPIGLEGGDVDLYGYCWDDPIHFVDRTGLSADSESESDGKGDSDGGDSGDGGDGDSSGGDAGSSGGSDSSGGTGGGSKGSSFGGAAGEAASAAAGLSDSLSGGTPARRGRTASKSSVQHAREMEAKAESLGYNTGLDNSRGSGGPQNTDGGVVGSPKNGNKGNSPSDGLADSKGGTPQSNDAAKEAPVSGGGQTQSKENDIVGQEKSDSPVSMSFTPARTTPTQTSLGINTYATRSTMQYDQEMEKSPEAQAEEAQEKERRDLERRAASRNYSTSPLTGKKVGQGPTNMLETKENEVTDSVFNVDYNEQHRKGEEKISSVQHARNMDRIANDPAKNTNPDIS
jgi:RHS repeat-associated protein